MRKILVLSVRKSDIVNDPIVFRLAMAILSGMVFAAIIIGLQKYL